MAIQDCDDALSGLYNMVKECHGAADHHVIINFGVHDGSTQFKLENLGRNIKNFGVPDERGNQPRNETINCEQENSHVINCALDLP